MVFRDRPVRRAIAWIETQYRIGPNGLPKPYVLAADARGDDLEITLTLFGMAVDWSATMSHTLACVVQHRIDWHDQDASVFVPKKSACQINLRAEEGISVPPPRTHADIRFLTPMNAEHDNPLDRPATILARLARRVEGLSRWQDVELDVDWASLADAWARVEYDMAGLESHQVDRRSGRGARTFEMPAIIGTLGVGNLDRALWPMLAIGQRVHAGKGGSEGFGRFRLE